MGHGARNAVAFVFLLPDAGISTLVEVRPYPVSRRHPMPWTDPGDCQRSHIADWLVARGERVVHLLEAEKFHEHAARLF